MRKLEKGKKFPGYVIAGFYILAGTLICCALFLLGSSLAKNPASGGSVLPVSAAAKEDEDASNAVENPEAADASPQEENPQETAEPEPVYYSFVTLNTRSVLHVREQPGMDGKIIDYLSPGTTGFVLEPGDGWSLIQTSGITGYVSNQYLQFQEIPEEEYLPAVEDASQ